MLESLILLALIALNGLFSMSELAVVSARRTRLRAYAEAGTWGAKRALALAGEPARFLSTVQIGITLIGIVAGAFSGATLGERLAAWLVTLGFGFIAAEAIGFGLVITAVTFLSIVFGELVPKQLALRRPERIACRTAPIMASLSEIAWPIVWLLQGASHATFKLFGLKPQADDAVSEEDVKALVAEAERSGAIATTERQMIAGVLRLGSRPVTGVMTPRTDVAWLNVAAGEDALRDALRETTHSRLPVGDGSIDAIIGIVQVRELIADMLSGRALDLRRRAHPALVIPDAADALDLLEKLRSAEVPVALIHDEYGSFQGLVTPADLLETIAGTFRSSAEDSEPKAVRRADGSYLIAGGMPVDEMADLLGFAVPETRQYQTAAGFVLDRLRHLPATGETFEANGWRFEIVDLDGRRIDKVLASRPGTRRAA